MRLMPLNGPAITQNIATSKDIDHVTPPRREHRKCDEFGVERRWMPSLPLTEFNETKRTGHSSWSIYAIYPLGLIQDA